MDDSSRNDASACELAVYRAKRDMSRARLLVENACARIRKGTEPVPLNPETHS